MERVLYIYKELKAFIFPKTVLDSIKHFHAIQYS